MIKKKQWLNQFVKSSHIGILVVDRERNNLFVNDYLCEMFGYSRETLLSADTEIFHTSHESFLNFAQLAFNAVLEGKSLGLNYQFKKSDGSLIWAYIVGDAIESNKEVLWTIVDKTHEIEMQEEMSKLNERMQLALLGNNDGVWDMNILKNELYISSRAKEIMGIEDSKNIFKVSIWEKFIHPDDKIKIATLLKKRLKEHLETSDEEYRFIHSDGSTVWVRAKAKSIFDENNSLIRIVGTYSDITEDKKREFEQVKLTQMLEQTHDAILSTDIEGYIESWNYGAERLLGYTKEEIIGEHLLTLDPYKDLQVFKQRSQKLLDLGELQVENDAISKEGKIIKLASSYTLIKDATQKITGIIAYGMDISKRIKVENELREQKSILDYQANHDALTNLANRTLFRDRLIQSLEKAKRNKTILALFFIDLDHFKEINDSLGHSVGDEILKIVSIRLEESIREIDSVARIGGDEYTIILENLKDTQSAALVATKLLDVLVQPIKIKEQTLYISSSIGISIYPDDSDSVENLLKFSDAAMYRAKYEGRNNYQFYSKEMTQNAVQRVLMETSLREALDREEFIVHYQPQVDARDDSIIGMEALVRWEHPTKGVLYPDSFIELAESIGLLVQIDRYVMNSAMQQFSKWRKMGLNPGKLSLNLTIRHLNQKDFMEVFEAMIERNESLPEQIELEVVESEIMKNPAKSIKSLNLLRDLGIAISVDDFGTGYSSLAYLKKLPIKKLKIDKSFVDNLPNNEDDVAITQAVIGLAKSLNLDIIAEGVEDEFQKSFLLENGCYKIQGYFYSKPISTSDMQIVLENGW